MPFLKKYKWTILFWLIYLLIVLYLAPIQSEYYLEKDINNFKKQYLQPTLILTGCILIVVLLILWFKNTKSFKKLTSSFFFASLKIAAFLFLFQYLFLAGSLFINKQFKKDSIQRTYIANYLLETDQTKNNFYPIDLADKQILNDRKLTNKLYKVGIKQNDTITLKFYKGLFGIAFQPEKFDDN